MSTNRIEAAAAALQQKKQLMYFIEQIFFDLDYKRKAIAEQLEARRAKNVTEEYLGWYDQEIAEGEQQLAAIDFLVQLLSKQF